jgi:poly(3-hydroxybutyrate) depolymerase
MKRALFRTAGVFVFSIAFALVGCTGSSDEGGSGAGSGGRTTVSTGTGGQIGTGGSIAGTGGGVGTGGSLGSGGSGVVTPGSGGAMTGSGGRIGGGGGRSGGGSGGASVGSGGRAGTAGSSGSGGATGAGGGAGGARASTGCGKAPPASNRYTIDVDGTMREYILFVPTNYDQSKPYRLIFAWHPLGGSAQQTAGSGNSGYYGLRGASNGEAILVSPEGLPFQGESLGWGNTGGRDLAFMRAMLERFKSEMCIDEARVFSTGFSFGGMMSFAVGCAGLARAIAPMAGNSQVSGCTNGTTSVAVMGFHGADDTFVSTAGGRTARDVFVMRNQCMQQTMPLQPSWCDGVSQQPCTCVSYQGCAAGYPVIWCEFKAGHTPAPNSGPTIWDFFRQF